MDFRILGSLDVRDHAGRTCAFVRRKQRLLLAVLLLEANKSVPVERIIDWLWGERPPSSAKQNLHSYVSGLRRALDSGSDGSRIETRAGRYLLRVEPGELDADVFEDLAAQGRRAAEEGDHATAVERLTRALGRWRTDVVLEGLPLPEPLRAETTRLERLRETAMEAAFDARLELGQHHDLVPELEATIRKRPLQERLWAQLMLALYRSGRQADALEVYQRAERTLAEELGVAPNAELRRLHAEIRGAAPAAGRTKPSPRKPTPNRPAQLPTDLASFTGREDELALLLQLAGNPEAGRRNAVLVSAIDGMAGIGKTALAIHAAHQLAASYPDGQLFVDLHGFTEGVRPIDPGEALDRLLRALGVPGAQVPNDLDERAALWRTQLAGRRLVVVLDNAATAAQVTPLLPGATNSVVLVTSRQRMSDLDDARRLSLDVLALPDAIALFTRTAGPDRLTGHLDDRVAEVVELCGRLPLAIRIAAARLRDRPSWTLPDLVERLRDQRGLTELETAHRGVTATLRLSYAQLPETHRRVFRLLGPHLGPDLDSYATAALADLDIRTAGRILDDLLDAHLLQQHRLGRYRFHDLVRAYAAQLCNDSEPESVRRGAQTRLFDYYTHGASTAADQLYPPEFDLRPSTSPSTPVPRLDRTEQAAAWLDAELPNLLAIPATEAADDYTFLLCAALHPHLRACGQHGAAETLHTKALELARRAGDRRGEYLALTGLGHALCGLGRSEAGREHFEAALEIARATDYQVGKRHALNAIANVHMVLGRWQPASEYFEQALVLARDLDEPIGKLGVRLGLGHLHTMWGDVDGALFQFDTALGIARDIRDRNAELIALNGQAAMHRAEERYQRAAECSELALTLARNVGDTQREVGALLGLAQLAREQADYDKAAERLEQALELAHQIANRNGQLEAWHCLGYTCTEAGHPERAIEKHQRVLELADELGQPTDTARAHHGLASAYYALGDTENAREHWLLTERIQTELDLTRNAEVDLDDVRTRLAELGRVS